MRDIESEYMRESRGKQRMHRQPVSVWARHIDSHRGNVRDPSIAHKAVHLHLLILIIQNQGNHCLLRGTVSYHISWFCHCLLSGIQWLSSLTRASGRVVVSLNRSLQMSLVIWRGRQQHKRLSERPTAAPVDLKIYQEWWALFHIMTSIKNISALY